jgi:hypothetical protein
LKVAVKIFIRFWREEKLKSRFEFLTVSSFFKESENILWIFARLKDGK